VKTREEPVEVAAMAVANHLTVGWDGIHENKTHWRATHGMLEGIYSDVNGPFQDDCREAARAAILAYLSTLVEDEGAVEACAVGICEAEGLMWADQFSIQSSNGDPDAHESYKHSARAVLRTLATRAQGESS
jgi:hypothetical protein